MSRNINQAGWPEELNQGNNFVLPKRKVRQGLTADEDLFVAGGTSNWEVLLSKVHNRQLGDQVTGGVTMSGLRQQAERRDAGVEKFIGDFQSELDQVLVGLSGLGQASQIVDRDEEAEEGELIFNLSIPDDTQNIFGGGKEQDVEGEEDLDAVNVVQELQVVSAVEVEKIEQPLALAKSVDKVTAELMTIFHLFKDDSSDFGKFLNTLDCIYQEYGQPKGMTFQEFVNTDAGKSLLEIKMKGIVEFKGVEEDDIQRFLDVLVGSFVGKFSSFFSRLLLIATGQTEGFTDLKGGRGVEFAKNMVDDYSQNLKVRKIEIDTESQDDSLIDRIRRRGDQGGRMEEIMEAPVSVSPETRLRVEEVLGDAIEEVIEENSSTGSPPYEAKTAVKKWLTAGVNTLNEAFKSVHTNYVLVFGFMVLVGVMSAGKNVNNYQKDKLQDTSKGVVVRGAELQRSRNLKIIGAKKNRRKDQSKTVFSHLNEVNQAKLRHAISKKDKDDQKIESLRCPTQYELQTKVGYKHFLSKARNYLKETGRMMLCKLGHGSLNTLLDMSRVAVENEDSRKERGKMKKIFSGAYKSVVKAWKKGYEKVNGRFRVKKGQKANELVKLAEYLLDRAYDVQGVKVVFADKVHIGTAFQLFNIEEIRELNSARKEGRKSFNEKLNKLLEERPELAKSLFQLVMQ